MLQIGGVSTRVGSIINCHPLDFLTLADKELSRAKLVFGGEELNFVGIKETIPSQIV